MPENQNEESSATPASESVEDVIATPITPAVEATAVEEPAEESIPIPIDLDSSEQVEEGFSHVERRLGVNPNATLSKSVTDPLKPGTQIDMLSALSLLNVDLPELNALAETNYKQSNVANSESGQEWLANVVKAQEYLQRSSALLGSVTRDGSHWQQQIDAGGQQLSAGRPRFDNTEGGAKLTGEHAVMKMQAVLKIGAIVRVPLWHTGLWVSIKAPTAASLLELDRRIAEEKVMLGRVTNGLLFSNTSVYVTSFLVNFALAHIYEASYKFNKPEELRSKIKITDIPTLLWGLLGAIYPNGYPFSQPCVTDPSVCTHITSEMLNIGKLSWTDQSALNDSQRSHMTRKHSKFPDVELDTYDRNHSFNKLAVLDLAPGLVAHLRVPTIEEYEQSGFDWVDGIVSQVDQAFGGSLKGEERNNFIMQNGQATALRQYAHWVEKLVLGGEDTIEDVSTIQEVLATMTSDEDIFKNFFDGIGRFIDASTISLIAIPKFNCPACGAPMTSDEKTHPHLIPLDVQNVFFTLLAHRITKVLQLAQGRG